MRAFELYGEPDFTRMDAGSENWALRWELLRLGPNALGLTRVKVGRSVDNHPVERFWREVRERVLDPFMAWGEILVQVGALNPEADLDLTCVQLAVMERLNGQLQDLMRTHNCRRIHRRGVPDVLFGDLDRRWSTGLARRSGRVGRVATSMEYWCAPARQYSYACARNARNARTERTERTHLGPVLLATWP